MSQLMGHTAASIERMAASIEQMAASVAGSSMAPSIGTARDEETHIRRRCRYSEE
jgi:methyl-accepting chemotaxis protein